MFDTFNLLAEIRRLETLKMFIPPNPEGTLQSRAQWGTFDTLSIL